MGGDDNRGVPEPEPTPGSGNPRTDPEHPDYVRPDKRGDDGKHGAPIKKGK